MNKRRHATGNATLAALAGTWTEAQAAEFDAAVAPFGQVDEEMWAEAVADEDGIPAPPEPRNVKRPGP